MKQIENTPKSSEIRVYQSPRKNLLLAFGCLAFAALGCLIIRDDTCDSTTKLLGGWLGVLFFGGGGLLVFAVTVFNWMRHIPFLIIDEDKVQFYVQSKRTYYPIRFADVKGFRMIRIYGSSQIAIDYKNASLLHKMDESSVLKQTVMAFNMKKIGAIESIPAFGLIMKGKDLLRLLNERVCANRKGSDDETEG